MALVRVRGVRLAVCYAILIEAGAIERLLLTDFSTRSDPYSTCPVCPVRSSRVTQPVNCLRSPELVIFPMAPVFAVRVHLQQAENERATIGRIPIHPE